MKTLLSIAALLLVPSCVGGIDGSQEFIASLPNSNADLDWSLREDFQGSNYTIKADGEVADRTRIGFTITPDGMDGVVIAMMVPDDANQMSTVGYATIGADGEVWADHDMIAYSGPFLEGLIADVERMSYEGEYGVDEFGQGKRRLRGGLHDAGVGLATLACAGAIACVAFTGLTCLPFVAPVLGAICGGSVVGLALGGSSEPARATEPARAPLSAPNPGNAKICNSLPAGGACVRPILAVWCENGVPQRDECYRAGKTCAVADAAHPHAYCK